jgi:hypothetical protein
MPLFFLTFLCLEVLQQNRRQITKLSQQADIHINKICGYWKVPIWLVAYLQMWFAFQSIIVLQIIWVFDSILNLQWINIVSISSKCGLNTMQDENRNDRFVVVLDIYLYCVWVPEKKNYIQLSDICTYICRKTMPGPKALFPMLGGSGSVWIYTVWRCWDGVSSWFYADIVKNTTRFLVMQFHY